MYKCSVCALFKYTRVDFLSVLHTIVLYIYVLYMFLFSNMCNNFRWTLTSFPLWCPFLFFFVLYSLGIHLEFGTAHYMYICYYMLMSFYIALCVVSASVSVGVCSCICIRAYELFLISFCCPRVHVVHCSKVTTYLVVPSSRLSPCVSLCCDWMCQWVCLLDSHIQARLNWFICLLACEKATPPPPPGTHIAHSTHSFY